MQFIFLKDNKCMKCNTTSIDGYFTNIELKRKLQAERFSIFFSSFPIHVSGHPLYLPKIHKCIQTFPKIHKSIQASVTCFSSAILILSGSVSNETFMSPQLRKKWIAQQMDTAKQNFLDGINFDYESVIGEVETDVRDAYTALVRETNEAFKKEMPYFQVGIF